jgi:hypothetical protein
MFSVPSFSLIFSFNLLPAFPCLHDVFWYVSEPSCSGLSHRSLPPPSHSIPTFGVNVTSTFYTYFM